MSVVYIPTPSISLTYVLNHLPVGIQAFEKYPSFQVPSRCLTDGAHFLWAVESQPGQVRFESFGQNKAADLLTRLEATLGVTIKNEFGLPINPEE